MSEYETRLDISDYIIVQDTDDYGFSQDSVILANLADIGKNDVVLDIGCGTGILSTLAIVKKGVKRAVGIDVQKHACDLARKSVQINGLQDKLQIIDGDVRDIKKSRQSGKFRRCFVQSAIFSVGRKRKRKRRVAHGKRRGYCGFRQRRGLGVALRRRLVYRIQSGQTRIAFHCACKLQSCTERDDSRLPQTFKRRRRRNRQGSQRRKRRSKNQIARRQRRRRKRYNRV